MKKTISITLHGQIFYLEEDAYSSLQNYLEEIKNHFSKSDDMDVQEIIEDIEASLAEKFLEKITSFKQAVTIKDVEELISLLGTVSDMDADGLSDSEENLKNEKTEEKKYYQFGKKLYRNPDDVVIAGVASGLAAYFGLDVVIARVIFLVTLLVGGLGFWVYIALWIAMPVAETKAQKLEMQGEPLNLANLSSDSKKKIVKEANKKNVQDLKNLDKKVKSVSKKVGGVSYTILRIISGFIAFGILLGAWLAIISVIFLTVVAFLDIRIPFFGSTAFFHHLFVGFPYVLIVLSLSVVVLVPLFFLVKIALFLFSFKSRLSIVGIFFSLTLWMLAVLVLGLATLDIGRTVEEKVIDFIEIKDGDYSISLNIGNDVMEKEIAFYILDNKKLNADELMGKKIGEIDQDLKLLISEKDIITIDENKLYLKTELKNSLEDLKPGVKGLSFLVLINNEVVDYGVIWPLYSSLIYEDEGLFVSYPFREDENGFYMQVELKPFAFDFFEYSDEDNARLLQVFEASAKLDE